MKVFIFQELAQVSDNYHSGGGLVIIANDRSDAKKMIEVCEDVEVDEKDWEDVLELELSNKQLVEKEIIVFPDAGCC